MAQQILETPASKSEANAAPRVTTQTSERKPALTLLEKDRRRVIWALIYGYLGINFLMFLRFFFPRALYEPNTNVSIGYPYDFLAGVTGGIVNSSCGMRGPMKKWSGGSLTPENSGGSATGVMSPRQKSKMDS